MSLFAGAVTYYVTPAGTSPFTGTQAAPWPYSKAVTEFAKATGSLINPGDSVLFQRGQTFDVASGGTLAINRNGTSNLRIYIGAYGAGAMPVLSGFRTVSAWVPLNGWPGVYESLLPVTSWDSTNYVLVNGTPQGIGRHPNATNSYNDNFFGYYKALLDGTRKDRILSVNPELNPGLGSWVGAWVWFRCNKFAMERKAVLSHGINATNSSQYELGVEPFSYNFGDSSYGFCFVNHLRTMDLNGEWMFDKPTKKLRMYFTGTPSGSTVRVAAARDIIQFINCDYVTIEGLRLEGAWRDGIRYFASSSNPAEYNFVRDCEVQHIGSAAVFGAQQRMNYNEFTGCFISDCNLVGVDLCYGGSFNKVNGNIIRRLGLIRENIQTPVGGLVGLTLIAIKLGGPNGTGNEARNNIIDSTAYIGVRIDGPATIVRDNIITNTQLVQSDGGGIYTYGGMNGNSLITKAGGQIVKNLIINPISPTALIAHPKAHSPGSVWGGGVYTDDGTGGSLASPLRIDSNTIINSLTNGIYIHNSFYISMRGNTVFSSPRPLYVHNDGITNGNVTTEDDSIYGLTIKGNKFHANTRYDAIAMYHLQYPGLKHMKGVGQPRGWDTTQAFTVSIDSNYWIKPVQAFSQTEFQVITNFRGSPAVTYQDPNPQAFAARWGYEPNSKITYVYYPGTSTADAAAKHDANVKFYYNTGTSDTTVVLDTSYYNEDGYLLYKNTPITLAPWSTRILVRYGATQPFAPPYGFAGVQMLKRNGATLKQNGKVLRKLIPLIQQNAWLWSEQLDNAATSKTGVTVTANTNFAPDGTLTADRATVAANNTSTRHLTQTLTTSIIAGNQYTFSAYVKDIDRQFVQMFVGATAFSSQAFANFDLTASAVTMTGSNVQDAGIEDAANGWKRVWLTARATTSQTSTLGTIALANSGTMPRATSYTTTTAPSLEVWGVQFNPGFKQPYIVTTSTAIQ